MFAIRNDRVSVLGAYLILGIVTAAAGAADLAVLSVEPTPRAIAAPRRAVITVHFDKPVKPSSIVPLQSFWAFGRWSGTVTGTFAFSDGDTTVSLIPDHNFSAGENVMVILSHDIEATDNTNLRPGGYSFQFWVRSEFAPLVFADIDHLNTRTTPGINSRAYGAIASDLNGDRSMDLAIINEDTADLRVFLNRNDQSGLYVEPFIQPTFPLGNRASPNEPADFNRDGRVDLCVANINVDTVSVLLGNGNGTFAPQQLINVGFTPRGVAVLDADGDGDVDIVNTNTDAGGGMGNLSVILNNGSGVFGGSTFFEGGVDGEWALGAADMNNDGLLDLVIGAQSGGRVVVNLNNGNGTFSPQTPRIASGVWMLALGDVNGDGNDDVAVVQNAINRGGILLGDGLGGLAAPVNHVVDSFPIAVDLADMDGDGDLDWITSSYGGDWFLFTNNGAGTFTFNQEFLAPQAASCATAVDFDNDGDVDLALIDELQDEVILMQNSGNHAIPAVSTWGLIVLGLTISVAASIRTRRVPLALCPPAGSLGRGRESKDRS